MKILIATIGHWQDRPSGAAKIAFDEATELRRKGEDVWILAAADPSLPRLEVKDGIHLIRYSPSNGSTWGPARALAHQRAARPLLHQHLPQVDVIHGHVPLATLAAFDYYADSAYRCYTMHSPAHMEMAIVWKDSGLLRRMTAPIGLAIIARFEAQCLRRSRAVTALSQYTIECVRKLHGQELSEKIRLVPGWVNTTRFAPVFDRPWARCKLGWPADIPILFTLRRLEARMGIDRLLRATHRLLAEGFRFHLMIGGSGSQRGKLERQVRLLGLNTSVTFMGRVADSELPMAYAACDAFVLPTAELECFGLIALEALSAGRPVLATPIGAIPEIIRSFEPSWLAQSAGTKDIADLIRLYLQGRLPAHAPIWLHNRVHDDYQEAKVIREFIDATIGGFNPSPCGFTL